MFSSLEREANFKQNPYNISHTPKVRCRTRLTCRKSKFKVATTCAPDRRLVDLLRCASASQSLISRISSLSSGWWRSTAAITATYSCRSSCCPWCATCQVISSSFNKTCSAPAQCTSGTRHCDFLSSQHLLLFLQIWGRQTALTLIRSITRYRVTLSSECISRSCTALTNWRTVCWTFGTSWTRAALTMQLTGGVSVFERVYGQKADISSNCCKVDNSTVCRTVWRDVSFHETWCLEYVTNLNFNFP